MPDVIEAAQQTLREHGIEEEVVWAIHCKKGARSTDFATALMNKPKKGILALTLNQMYFIHMGIFGAKAVEDLDYSWTIAEDKDTLFSTVLTIGGHPFIMSGSDRRETAAMIRKVRDQAAQTAAADIKTCPRCAEEIKAAAKMCRFCGYEFEV